MATREELIKKVARLDYWGARGLGPATETARRIVDRLIADGDLTVDPPAVGSSGP